MLAAGCADDVHLDGAPGGGGAGGALVTGTGGTSLGVYTAYCKTPIPPGAPSGSGFAATWTRDLGDAPDGWVVGPFAVGADAAGGTFVAGSYYGSYDLGTGTGLSAPDSYDGYLAGLSTSGEPLWLGQGPSLANDVAVVGESVWVSASISDVTLARFTPAGKAAFTWPAHPYGLAPIAPAAAGGVWLADEFVGGAFDDGAEKIPRGAGTGIDVALLRFDAAGNVVKARSLGDALWPTSTVTRNAQLGALAPAPDGGVLAAVTLSEDAQKDTEQIALLRFDADAHLVWSRFVSPGAYDVHPRVFSDAQGNALVVFDGSAYGALDFACASIPPNATALVYVDAAGAPRWWRSYEGIRIVGGGFDPAGNVLLVGNLDGAVDLGGGPLPWPAGATSRAFALALAPDGAHLASRSFGDSLEASCASIAPDGALLLAGAYAGASDLGLPEAATRRSFVARLVR